jgi:hypothetical protein
MALETLLPVVQSQGDILVGERHSAAGIARKILAEELGNSQDKHIRLQMANHSAMRDSRNKMDSRRNLTQQQLAGCNMADWMVQRDSSDFPVGHAGNPAVRNFATPRQKSRAEKVQGCTHVGSHLSC